MFKQDTNDYKSYEYGISIDIHIYIYIYILISFKLNYKLYKNIKFKICIENLLRSWYFNFEICIDKSHIKSVVINGLNFCYNKYTNVNKIIWVGSVNNKYLYWNILYIYIYIYRYISMSISLKFKYILYKVNKMIFFIYLPKTRL